MLVLECSECGVAFDLHSKRKRSVGGLRTHCPDCSEEHAVKYLGVQSGDGKQASISILSFDSENDRETYKSFWKNNSGFNVGKSCQLGTHLSTTPSAKWKIVSTEEARNHKGKL